MISPARRPRVLSGMRPTGLLHLGHYFLLRKWVELQETCDCSFFIADYHALTTSDGTQTDVQANTRDMVVCWLAAGLDPKRSVMFVQSQLREHAELHLLLSMVTPQPWLERVPHYKDVASKSKAEDLSYGFLGYPVLQAADIIAHNADYVPVGDDQEAHVELAARIARTFNNLYGKPDNWKEEAARIKSGFPDEAKFDLLCRKASQDGDRDARDSAREMIYGSGLEDREKQIMLGWVDQGGREVLLPPEVLKAEVSRLPGLDGSKMSKSDNNYIGMLEEKASYAAKIKRMPTDPARVKRTDPGDPEKCPVWDYHKIFSADGEREHVDKGCRSAGIGCLECKGILCDNIERTVAPLREKAAPLLDDTEMVRKIIIDGNERARAEAGELMAQVRTMVGLPQA